MLVKYGQIHIGYALHSSHTGGINIAPTLTLLLETWLHFTLLSVLYCTSTVLYCTALYCTVLYFAILCYSLDPTPLHSTPLSRPPLHPSIYVNIISIQTSILTCPV